MVLVSIAPTAGSVLGSCLPSLLLFLWMAKMRMHFDARWEKSPSILKI